MKSKYSLLAALVLSLLVAAVFAAPAGAAGNPFTCRASVVRLTVFGPPSNPFEPYTANWRNTPCRADEEGIQGRRKASNGLVTNGLTSAMTEGQRPAAGKNVVSAHSEVADLSLRNKGADTVRVGGATSRATVRCTADGALALATESHVGRVKIGDLVLSLGSKPQTLDLGAIKLHANRVIKTGNEVTVRALEVVIGNLDLVVAESRAGFTGASSCG